MEGATHFLSDLALAEVQKETILVSFMIVFRKMAKAELCSTSFRCLTTATPSPNATQYTQERVPVSSASFSPLGKICVERCLKQLEKRFPPVSAEEIMILLLDPRTNNIAASMMGDMSVNLAPDEIQTKKMASAARDKLAMEHLHFFKLMRPTQPASSSPSSEILHAPEPSASRIYMFGAPVPSSSNNDSFATHAAEEADAVMRRWLDLDVDWARVAAQQDSTGKTESEVKSMMIVRNGSAVVWNSLKLYRQVDILRWFREEGEIQFPSIALVARI